MTIERELLKEVLEYFDPLGLNTEHCGDLPERIKELLAQPEQDNIQYLLDQVARLTAENAMLKEKWLTSKQPEQEQEPVAWIIETEIHGKLSEWVCTDKKHYMEEHDSIKDPIPLYTAPPKQPESTAEAVMPNGVCVSNVYDAYEEGRKSVMSEQEPVAWVWNPTRDIWERVVVFGHWQKGAIYAFGSTAPEAELRLVRILE